MEEIKTVGEVIRELNMGFFKEAGRPKGRLMVWKILADHNDPIMGEKAEVISKDSFMVVYPSGRKIMMRRWNNETGSFVY